MIGGNSGERRGNQCHAVVALLSCNHLDAVRLAEASAWYRINLSSVSLASRTSCPGKPDHPASAPSPPIYRQLDRGGVGLATKHVAKAEFAHLALGGFNDFLVPVAKAVHRETCHALQIALACRRYRGLLHEPPPSARPAMDWLSGKSSPVISYARRWRYCDGSSVGYADHHYYPVVVSVRTSPQVAFTFSLPQRSQR